MFSRALDAARLQPARFIEALIPRRFDHALYFPDSRDTTCKSFTTLRVGGVDIADEHLDVVIATEVVTLIFPPGSNLADVPYGGVAEVRRLDVMVLLEDSLKDG